MRNDPGQITNLAKDPKHVATRKKLAAELAAATSGTTQRRF
jgi:hypothetical protein